MKKEHGSRSFKAVFRKWLRTKGSILLFLSPILFFVLVFLAFPLLSTIYLSMTDVQNNVFEKHHFIFLDGYVKTLTANDIYSQSFYKALENQFYYVTSYFIFILTLSLGVAILLNELRRGNDFFQVIYYLPMIIPLSIVGGIFQWIFSGTTSGFTNIALKALGLIHRPYDLWQDYNFALFGLMIARAWKMAGFTIIIFLAGLKGISNDIREAAAIDGASRFKEIFHITLPLLRPYLFIGATWIIINSMKEYDLPSVVTRAGPGQATLTLYFWAWELGLGDYQQMGKAAQVAFIIALLIFIITFILNKIFKTEPAGRA